MSEELRAAAERLIDGSDSANDRIRLGKLILAEHPADDAVKEENARLTAERETNEHNAFIAGWEAAFRYGNPDVGLGVVADNVEEAYSLFKERAS